MIVKNTSYYNPENYLYLDEKRKLAVQRRIQKQMEKHQFKDR